MNSLKSNEQNFQTFQNFMALVDWPTTVTAKSFYSRQNQFRHSKINFATAISELNTQQTLSPPNSLCVRIRDSGSEYIVICIFSLCYPCLLGILLHFYSFLFHSLLT